ncbi:MAG: hypothetical protein ABI332_05620 [Polyangiaceae bacterium]
MQTSTSRFLEGALALGVIVLTPRVAFAQACCAGSSALTPGRLALHEDELVGVQAHASTATGAFDDKASFTGTPNGVSDYEFEEDAFAAARVFDRGQLALLVPFVETARRNPNESELGGGIGDVNLSVRYDLHLAGQSRWFPGIALLAGETFPTGTSPNRAKHQLATDATGTGAFQGNGGLALEQTFGPVLVQAATILAVRAPYSANGVNETLGPQLTTLFGAAYTFDNGVAIATSFTYTLDGSATINGETAQGSARHVANVGLSGLLPLSDTLRLQGGVNFNPPWTPFGRNQSTTAGLVLGIIRSWS